MKRKSVEADVLEKYLPARMSEAELKELSVDN